MAYLFDYLTIELNSALLCLKALEAENEVELLHQFRVHLRRIISLLELYHPHAHSIKSLKSILKKSNKIRDLDVLIASLGESAPLLQAHLRFLRNETYRERIDEYFLHATRHRLKHTLNAFSRRHNHDKNKQRLKYLALRQYRKSIQRHQSLYHHADDHAFHRVRLAFKTSRYALQFLQTALHVKVKKELRFTKQIQEELGSVQDLSQQLIRLKKICKNQALNECPKVIASIKAHLNRSKAATLKHYKHQSIGTPP
ncbi:MAG: CHAD domain-containing protein [Campylobacterales bacterium]|nr:CHAD domain-containing protein [Campylobacterales bacterium]